MNATTKNSKATPPKRSAESAVVTTSISMPSGLLKAARKRAKEEDLDFSTYLRRLARRDLETPREQAAA